MRHEPGPASNGEIPKGARRGLRAQGAGRGRRQPISDVQAEHVGLVQAVRRQPAARKASKPRQRHRLGEAEETANRPRQPEGDPYG